MVFPKRSKNTFLESFGYESDDYDDEPYEPYEPPKPFTPLLPVPSIFNKRDDYDDDYGASYNRIGMCALGVAESVGELGASTFIEENVIKSVKFSVPQFSSSMAENAITGLPFAGIKFIYGKTSSPEDEFGLTAGAGGLVTLVFAGPVAAFAVAGIAFAKYVLSKIFG